MATTQPERYQVLLVHDDPAVRLRVQQLLEGSSAQARPAGRLGSGLEEADPSPDCVLLGIGDQPQATFDQIRLITRLAPAAAVVVLIEEEHELAGLAATSAGAQDSLVLSSLTRSLLLRAIRYAVERKRSLQSERLLQESEARSAERSRLERGLLPRPLVRDEQLRCVTLYRPGAEQALLGGDFYDVVELQDGTVLAVIGDVAGHGADEAAFGVELRVAWRTVALVGLAGYDTLGALEQVLLAERHDVELFVTACEVLVAPDRRTARFRCAGHPPPLLLDRAGGVEVPPLPVGPPLGVAEGMGWRAATVDLADQEALFLYTDGLVEGLVGDRGSWTRLGVEGLVEVVADELSRGRDLGDLVGRVVERVRTLNGGDLVDDVAVLGLALGAGAGPPTGGSASSPGGPEGVGGARPG